MCRMVTAEHDSRSYLFRFVSCALLGAIVGLSAAPGLSQAVKAPPKTRTENVKETLHGVEIVDPYRWLENQDSPETRSWINAENNYTQSLLGSVPGRERLKQRISELLKIDIICVPRARNGRYFFTKRLATQDLPVIYMRSGFRGADEVLIDPHGMSPDHTVSVSLVSVSQDGALMAYGIRQGGQDEVTISFLNVDTRKELPDRLPKARYGGISLKPDKSGLYYSRYGSEGPRVYYHAMGSDVSKDLEVFGSGYGEGKFIGCQLSEDGRYLVLTVSHGSAATKTELYYQDITKQGGPQAGRTPDIETIVNDIEARFGGEIAGDHLFMETNWEAPNERILDVDLKNPARNKWREVIPTCDMAIDGFSAIGGKLFVSYIQNVTSRIKVFEPGGEYVRDLPLPPIGTAGGPSGRWESNEAFYTYASFLVPSTVYRYDVAKGTQEIWSQIRVPFQSDRFEVKQVWYESKDRTKIPMFIIHARGLKLDGSHPTLLTGYGGFTVSLTPGFSSRAAVWVENGGVYAVPNLRGGGEFGEEWHLAGMLEKKQNVFDDFIAAAEWLVKNGYTAPSKLAISGGSNGGLLVGAALTQRPDLFQAVVCAVPLLDMVRYHKFLVAKFWVPEYGSSDDPKQFKYIYAYSPYHHVKSGTKYPSVLFISGDSDTRVAPLHARKMTALMQAATGSDRPVLLHYDTKAGHAGGQPVTKQIDDLTDELSFLFWQLGMKSA